MKVGLAPYMVDREEEALQAVLLGYTAFLLLKKRKYGYLLVTVSSGVSVDNHLPVTLAYP